ncbi:hypothetical protein Pmani_009064 [Petrolisthes manimaculis]|uniref:Large ribosomal subunit protein bL9m n=1 Tax=Petrolisthes manimaculis TaxID=1843537 RepID=A0AAE1UDY5_9EUCA|nr:hypothetical protein Pmani_009064 [Petrolisthes manimaculis]
MTSGNTEVPYHPSPMVQQVRTTFILKRKHKLHLVNAHANLRSRRLKARHFIYELVEDTNIKKKEPVKVILKTAIDGLGSLGEVVEVKPNRARNHLLLQDLAVYASPENIEKYASLIQKRSDEDQPSSPFALKTVKMLLKRVVSVSMNLHNPWTIEPWHLRVAFRRAGIIVPEEAFTLPPQPICGPDLSLQNKEFAVKVKINGKEEATVRCRINHFASQPTERLPCPANHWQYPAEPIFPEQAAILEELTRNNPITRYHEEDAEAY